MRIHLIPETPISGPPWACAEIRLLRPYQHPLMQRHIQVSTGPRLPADRVDAVVVQRSLTSDATLQDAMMLLHDIRHRDIRLIYDLDDDLLSPHPTPAVEQNIMPSRSRIRLLLREADAVIVSTTPLANRVRHLNPSVFIWPNAIDERLASEIKPADDEGADIGYFGTMSHLSDLLSVLESVEEAMSNLPKRPEMELCGISGDPRLSDLFAAQCNVRLLPVNGHYAAFQARLQQHTHWKTGLAPLVDELFNHCKSDIKFLDYALAGIPGVYADCLAYGSVLDGETGLKAAPNGFGIAVRRLLEDHDLRRHIRTNARRHVMEHRTLHQCVPALLDIVKQIL